jgi:D-glycero-D-manno-heptose 1,7-bisphosphate phosphatase
VSGAGRPAVFLDRDGVLNEASVGPDGVARGPVSVDQLRITPGAAEALARLRDAGFLLIVVTNQPDIGRGLVTAEAVAEIHRALRAALPMLDAVYTCPHGGAEPCECRKPRPGMVLAATADLGISLPDSWLIGDRWVDLAAAAAAGVRPVLLEHPHSWAPTSAGSPPVGLRPEYAGSTLDACVDHVVGVAPGPSRTTPRARPG